MCFHGSFLLFAYRNLGLVLLILCSQSNQDEGIGDEYDNELFEEGYDDEEEEINEEDMDEPSG